MALNTQLLEEKEKLAKQSAELKEQALKEIRETQSQRRADSTNG